MNKVDKELKAARLDTENKFGMMRMDFTFPATCLELVDGDATP